MALMRAMVQLAKLHLERVLAGGRDLGSAGAVAAVE